MIAKVKEVLQKDLIKVTSYSAISTVIKMFSSFITMKVMAYIVGPAGIALMGQFTNFLAIIITFANGGINGGVVKYVAENRADATKTNFYVSTAVWITIALSLIVGLLTIFFCRYFSQLILHSVEYFEIFILLGFTIIFYALNSILLSILNAFKEFRRFTEINITSSIIGLVVSILLVIFWHVTGALVALVISQSCVFFYTLYRLRNEVWLSRTVLFENFSVEVVNQFAKYSLMAIATAIAVPTTQLLIRSHIASQISLESAGIWEGMNRVSGIYLLLITTSLSVYVLPRLSEINDENELKSEILGVYRILLPMLLLGCSLLYLCRDVLVEILFTSSFFTMNELFLTQLIGDFLKISSWVLGTLLVVKSMYKHFIFLEIGISLLLYYLSRYLVPIYGIKGATISYLLSYLVYLTILIVTFRKMLFRTQ